MQPVGIKKPNAFGLYDMCGNVREWCNDLFSEDYYSKSPASDPFGPDNGNERVIRGGSFQDDLLSVACGKRSAMKPDAASVVTGFRVVLVSQ
jgi:formylglycine-generating enzyme required for sulfatase activity